MGGAVRRSGGEGQVGRGKLEAVQGAVDRAQKASSERVSRSRAGALVTLEDLKITVERAPSRRKPGANHP